MDELGTIINYVNYETEKPFSDSLGMLSDNTLLSILIPAYNEGDENIENSNISKTLMDLINQTTPEGKKMQNYEIVVVDNNSTDNTYDIVKQISYYSTTPINIIREPKQGYEHALKKGLDTLVQRFLGREIKSGSVQSGLIKHKEYSMSVTDADSTGISNKWVFRIMELMDDEKVSCFGGPMPPSPEDYEKFPNICKIIDKYLDMAKPLWEIFGSHTPGANMGIRPYWYSRVGGVRRAFDLPYAMDVYMGNRVVSLGGTSKMLPDDAYVSFNLRRVLDDPYKWFTGNSYASGMDDIREIKDVDLAENLIDVCWDSRKRNTIDTLFFLQALLKPNYLFEKEDLIKEYFHEFDEFIKFRERTLFLEKIPLLEAKDILFNEFYEHLAI